MMWCYRYHLHSKWNFARIQSKKIISITPLIKNAYPFVHSTMVKHYKSNKGVLFNQVICRKNFLTIAVEVCNADYE